MTLKIFVQMHFYTQLLEILPTPSPLSSYFKNVFGKDLWFYRGFKHGDTVSTGGVLDHHSKLSFKRGHPESTYLLKGVIQKVRKYALVRFEPARLSQTSYSWVSNRRGSK